MGDRLREGFSAFVHTTDEQVINTLSGPVKSPVELFVKPGEELPDNLADGEYERLESLGAFEPVPPIEQRIHGVVANNPAILFNTAPEGEEVTTPSDIRGGDGDEDDDDEDEDRPAKATAKKATAKKATAKKATAKSSVHGR